MLVAWAALETAVLGGTGMANQQVLLTVSVPQAFLATILLLLLIDLEQGCAVCHNFAQKEEPIIVINWSCKQCGTIGAVFHLPTFTVPAPVLL